jgi:predicted O-methyltransferase YrrM
MNVSTPTGEHRRLRRVVVDLRYFVKLRVLPLRIAWFGWRARRLASRTGDQFGLVSATRPDDLALLLKLAQNRRRVVELGTGTGWTAIALALADTEREVITYDPIYRPERERYVALAGRRVQDQITFVNKPGSADPHDHSGIDMLYIDSSHGRQATIEELHAWQPVLRSGTVVALDDFTHQEFPGVREAVRELGLTGSQHGTLFVHTTEAPKQ